MFRGHIGIIFSFALIDQTNTSLGLCLWAKLMLSGPRQRCWHFGMQNSYIRYPPRLTKGKRNVRHQTWHSWSAPLLLGVSFFSFKNIFVLRIRDRSQYFPIITISVDFCIISYHLKNQTFQGLAVSQYKDKLCLIAMLLDGHCPKPTERKSLAPVPIVTTYRELCCCRI